MRERCEGCACGWGTRSETRPAPRQPKDAADERGQRPHHSDVEADQRAARNRAVRLAARHLRRDHEDLHAVALRRVEVGRVPDGLREPPPAAAADAALGRQGERLLRVPEVLSPPDQRARRHFDLGRRIEFDKFGEHERPVVLVGRPGLIGHRRRGWHRHRRRQRRLGRRVQRADNRGVRFPRLRQPRPRLAPVDTADDGEGDLQLRFRGGVLPDDLEERLARRRRDLPGTVGLIRKFQ